MVDNGSREMLAQRYSQITLLANDRNVRGAAVNNHAVARCRCLWIWMLNGDAKLLPEALPDMLALIDKDPRVVVVRDQLLNPYGSLLAFRTIFLTLFQDFLIHTGAGRILLRRQFPSHNPQSELGPPRVDYIEMTTSR